MATTCNLVAQTGTQRFLRAIKATAGNRLTPSKSGIKRWFGGVDGKRIGLGARHPAKSIRDLAPTLVLDEALILRRFKHDPKAFEAAKQAFLKGLNDFPQSL